jgi:hypothetical protein
MANTFILKWINRASIGNVFDCHVRGVRETRATRTHIFTEKAPISAQFSTYGLSLNFPYLKHCKIYESGNGSEIEQI